MAGMPPVAVRVATIHDRELLRWLRSRWTAELGQEAPDPAFAERFSSWLAHQQDRTFWVATDGGQPVGMVNVLVVRRMPRPGLADAAWGYLGNLFVVPERRREGVASRLVQAVLDDATARRLVRLVLHPNEASVPFWQSRAFAAGDLWVRDLT